MKARQYTFSISRCNVNVPVKFNQTRYFRRYTDIPLFCDNFNNSIDIILKMINGIKTKHQGKSVLRVYSFVFETA